MNNSSLLTVEGRNVCKFLKRLSDYKIEVYQINVLTSDKMTILVNNKDLEKIEEIKTIYEINKDNDFGLKRYLRIIKKNLILIILIIINLIIIKTISNYLFEIEVIDNNKELKDFIIKELNNNGIKPWHVKKSYEELTTIKDKILNENKEKLEWLEIVESGVKYIVKVEERIKNPLKKMENPSNIVASKNGIVKKILASNGQVLVMNETYVRKGDILISGTIKLNDKEKDKVQAKGEIYGETWYKVRAEQSFHEKLDELTGKTKKGLRIRYFNRDYKMYKDFNNSVINENILVFNQILPIYISLDNVQEKDHKDLILSYEDALNLAIKKAKKRLNDTLDSEEKIISENQLKVEVKDSKIIVDILFTVYEKISVEERIEVEHVS